MEFILGLQAIMSGLPEAQIVEELIIKGKVHEIELLSELEKYAKSKTDTLEFRTNIAIWGNEKRYKEIDAIWKRRDFTYIIEAKPQLNFEAIGQVFVYEYLYQNIKEKIKKGIVCKKSIDQDLLSFCLKKDITVFELTKNGVDEHLPNAV